MRLCVREGRRSVVGTKLDLEVWGLMRSRTGPRIHFGKQGARNGERLSGWLWPPKREPQKWRAPVAFDAGHAVECRGLKWLAGLMSDWGRKGARLQLALWQPSRSPQSGGREWP